MSTSLRCIALLGLLLSVACGTDELSVRGELSASVDGASHVFDFPATINLAADGFEQDVFAGHCEFQGSNVSVGIVRPGPGESGFSRFSLQTTDAGVSVEVFVDGVRYEGGCEVDVLYSDAGDGVFAAQMNCESLGEAALSGELHFAGCL